MYENLKNECFMCTGNNNHCSAFTYRQVELTTFVQNYPTLIFSTDPHISFLWTHRFKLQDKIIQKTNFVSPTRIFWKGRNQPEKCTIVFQLSFRNNHFKPFFGKTDVSITVKNFNIEASQPNTFLMWMKPCKT